jgi:hypothetical protein
MLSFRNWMDILGRWKLNLEGWYYRFTYINIRGINASKNIYAIFAQWHMSVYSFLTLQVSCTRNGFLRNINLNVKIKLSITPLRRMGEWMSSSTVLYLCTRWRWVVICRPRALYLKGKSSRYPLDRKIGGQHNLSGLCGEEPRLSRR